MQTNNNFWKKKTSEKTVRAPRAKSKAVKKSKKKIGEAADPPEDAEESDQEVELDSLASFFIHLINNDYHQDDAEVSYADHVEVISLSSDSDLVPVQRFRRAVRKVKCSHPLAYLDPKFSLKTKQQEGCRTTRNNGQQVTSSGLPDTPPRKRCPEVSSSFNKPCPLAGCFRNPLNPSDSNYQVSSNSSSGSSSINQLPPLKTFLGKVYCLLIFHFMHWFTILIFYFDIIVPRAG